MFIVFSVRFRLWWVYVWYVLRCEVNWWLLFIANYLDARLILWLLTWVLFIIWGLMTNVLNLMIINFVFVFVIIIIVIINIWIQDYSRFATVNWIFLFLSYIVIIIITLWSQSIPLILFATLLPSNGHSLFIISYHFNITLH